MHTLRTYFVFITPVMTFRVQYCRTQSWAFPMIPCSILLTPSCSALMFYKQNSFGGKVAPTDAQAAYQPQGIGGLKEAKAGPIIEPPMSSSASRGIFSAWPNEIRKWQEVFQKGSAPVYLKRGTRDLIVYRGLWGLFAVGGIGTLYCLYGMATGTLKKKERS